MAQSHKTMSASDANPKWGAQQLQMWGFPLRTQVYDFELRNALYLQVLVIKASNSQMEVRPRTRDRGWGHRTSRPSPGRHPTNTRVCSPTQKLSRTCCFEVFLWRFHYIGKTDWITGHGDWAQSLMPLPSQNVGGEAENFNPLIVWLVFLATCPHPETI